MGVRLFPSSFPHAGAVQNAWTLPSLCLLPDRSAESKVHYPGRNYPVPGHTENSSGPCFLISLLHYLCHCLPTLGFADGELTKNTVREKSTQSFNWFYLWLDAEVTEDEMKFMCLNCALHSLLYPREMLLGERCIDARPLASSTFPTKAKGCDASENTATQQRASRISLGKEEGGMRWD